MITAAETLTLLAAIVIVTGMATLVWLAMALIARVSPRASLTMAGTNAAAALSLTLYALRGGWPEAVTHWPGDVLAVVSFGLLGVAVQAINRREPPWRTTAAVVAATAVVLAWLRAGGADDSGLWSDRVVNGTGAALALAAGMAAWRSLRRSGGRTPAPLALPLLLIGGLMLLRSGASFTATQYQPDLLEPTEFNLVFLWAALTLTLLQNATLAFLVLVRLILRIEHLLARDPLTDALNRRAFDQALTRAHAEWGQGRGYALVMIDMDHFKQLNDTLGHAAGDAALRLLAQQLKPCVRGVDHFGRLGGEEFGVLLPDTDLAGAALVAEHMRLRVERTPLRWLEQDWPLSASFGIAEVAPADTSGDAVLARADAALYRAKQQGRNLVQD